jgi:hypothetical protein
MKIPKIDLVDLISNLAPWLTPIPSAVLVANATVRHLDWSEPVGWIAGLIVEMLGISTVDTTMRYYNWNQEKRASDPALPTWILPGVLVSVYLTVTVILTVLLDTNPLLARWSPVTFPVLALVGAINLVLRRNYRILQDHIAAERERMRNLRQAANDARKAAPAAAAPSEPLPAAAEPSEPIKRYICQTCIREFRSANALNAHLRSHRNGSKPERTRLPLEQVL